jgi:TolA-binding protein
VDDLLALERRRPLSLEEQRARDEHLGACALCRAAASVRDAVGPLPPVDDDDRRLAERLVARALAPRALVTSAAPARPETRRAALGRPRGSGAVRVRRSAVAAAAILLLAGAASAGWWRYKSPPPAEAPDEGASPAKRAHRRWGRVDGTERPSPPEPLPAPTEPAMAPPPVVAAPPSPPPVVAAPPSPPPATASHAAPAPHALVRQVALARRAAAVELTPSGLFRDANEARRAQRYAEAERRYRELQAAFPASAEASLSHLSLGDLRLQHGAPEEALTQFDAYLTGSDAALAEEAMVGKARALARLGQGAAERAVWQALLARFPSSDYRWRAQQRLDELARGAP